jgi:hypothetical protein
MGICLLFLLDLGDRSERIRVERDPTLCDLLNRDICNISGWSNFGNKSCVYCACSYRFTYCSYLEFDLTLGVIPSVYVASSCSLYFSKLYCV